MAENKTSANLGANLGAGAGIFAKRFQKSLNRAQEKVLQKLGKTMETRDEQFEQCSQNLSKQQADGSRLLKDVKAYYNAVKAMHEMSRRLSHTLKDIYESDWHGVEDLPAIMESENLLWNDYEEKLNDQIVCTMENYSSQFPEVKERVAKRGRKLVDYDSARHHLEALQNAKKRDDAKIIKAEEEFNKVQCVFEEINNELREELPVLHQSRIGCYIKVFQNISNLRDVFYKEMSVLNHDLYDVMKKLDTQHSGNTFIIKGLNCTKPKKRKSLVISGPVLCNTAFPSDHHSTTSTQPSSSTSDDPSSAAADDPDETAEEKDVASDSECSATDSDTHSPKRLSVCSEGEEAKGLSARENGHQTVVQSQEDASGERTLPQSHEPANTNGEHSTRENTDSPPGGSKPISPPVPTPRVSHSAAAPDPHPTDEQTTKESDANSDGTNPPGFLYRAKALESQESDDGLLLLFEKGDVILVFRDDTEEKPEGSVWGVREEDWVKHHDLVLLSGTVMENLINRADAV